VAIRIAFYHRRANEDRDESPESQAGAARIAAFVNSEDGWHLVPWITVDSDDDSLEPPDCSAANTASVRETGTQA